MANYQNRALIPINQIFCLLLVWYGLTGLTIYIVGLYGRLNPTNIAIFCLIPLVATVFLTINLFKRFVYFSFPQKILTFLITCQLALYSLGIFIPETGFDALWYHLPEAQVYASLGQIAKIPEIMYSTMPRLGEMFYTAAFFTNSLIAVKTVAFLNSLLFILAAYFLSRLFLSRSHSLLVTLTVNSLYLIAWQSSSAYVDLLRAVFELGALLCLLSLFKLPNLRRFPVRDLLLPISLAAILLGFALSVKMQSLLGLVALTLLLVVALRFWRFSVFAIVLSSLFFILVSLFIASPWYLDNYLQSGHPLYPINTPEIRQNILSHVNRASETAWFMQRFTRLPLIFWDLGTLPVYQLSPLILILSPFLLFRLKFIISRPLPLLLLLFTFSSLLLWWFLPPAESRYLLPTLPPLIILLFYAVFSLPANFLPLKQLALLFIFLSLTLNFALRAAASKKYLPVLSHSQSAAAYINSQTTDFNRGLIEPFYQGYWKTYRYPAKSNQNPN